VRFCFSAALGATQSSTPSNKAFELTNWFDFIANQKTAKQIGLTIPPNVLVRADKVIR